MSTGKIMANHVCRGNKNKERGMPYTCNLTKIFKHFKMSFEMYTKEKVKSSWVVKKESLKNMKIYKQRIEGSFFGLI